jgi:hypothetical protein
VEQSSFLFLLIVGGGGADFISDGLVPHLLNQLQDVRCKRLPHRRIVYFVVTTVYGLYAAVSQLFLIFLALGQLDLLVARLCSDLAANLVTTHLYLETKRYDPLLARALHGENHVVDEADDDENDYDDDDDDDAGGRSIKRMAMHDGESGSDVFDESADGCGREPPRVVVGGRMGDAAEMTRSSFGAAAARPLQTLESESLVPPALLQLEDRAPAPLPVAPLSTVTAHHHHHHHHIQLHPVESAEDEEESAITDEEKGH